MVNRESDAANVRVPPPLAYIFAVAAGVALHLFAVPLDLALPTPARIVAAVLTAGAGVLLIGAALAAFVRTGQNPKPWTTTSEFIATGVYRLSRNPMYAGLALVQVALAFALANGWILALVPAVLAVVYATAVRPEEAYLEVMVGDELTLCLALHEPDGEPMN